jgi:hypothetical protein
MSFRYRWKHKDGSIVEFSEKGSRTDDPGKDAWLNKMSVRNSHSPVLTLGIKIWLQRNCQLVESGGLDEAHNLESFPVNRGNEFDRPEAAASPMTSTAISSALPAARPASLPPIPSSSRTPTASSDGARKRPASKRESAIILSVRPASRRI